MHNMMLRFKYFPLFILPLVLSLCNGEEDKGVCQVAEGELIITEFMADPAAVDDIKGEWLEIYNTTTKEIPLTGIQLSDASETMVMIQFGDLEVSQPGQYLVVGKNSDTTTNGGITVDGSYAGSMTFNNSDETLKLSCADVVVDEVTYTGSSPGRSLQLHPDHLDSAGNDDPENWCEAGDEEVLPSGDFGTPGEENVCPETVECPEEGALIITEVMADPEAVGDNQGEWFEIYNTTFDSVPLAGVIIENQSESSYTIGSGTIQAQSFLVLGRNDDETQNGGVEVDIMYSGINIVNSNGSLSLSCLPQDSDLAILIDMMSYTSSTTGASMQLSSDEFDHIANDDPANWCPSTEPYGDGDFGTPGTDNSQCGNGPAPTPGDVIFSEIMANPAAVNDDAGEWLELYNTTPSPVDLNGWTLTDNAGSHTIAGSLIIPPGGYVVLGKSTDTGTNGDVPVDYGFGASIALGNGGDELSLSYAGTEVDAVVYEDGTNGWIDVPNGKSLQLDPGFMDHNANNSGANWCEAATVMPNDDWGTPGSDNTPCN